MGKILVAGIEPQFFARTSEGRFYWADRRTIVEADNTFLEQLRERGIPIDSLRNKIAELHWSQSTGGILTFEEPSSESLNGKTARWLEGKLTSHIPFATMDPGKVLHTKDDRLVEGKRLLNVVDTDWYVPVNVALMDHLVNVQGTTRIAYGATAVDQDHKSSRPYVVFFNASQRPIALRHTLDVAYSPTEGKGWATNETDPSHEGTKNLTTYAMPDMVTQVTAATKTRE
ncbi:MAG: hypothetical protein ABH864_03090 [archaeon]